MDTTVSGIGAVVVAELRAANLVSRSVHLIRLQLSRLGTSPARQVDTQHVISNTKTGIGGCSPDHATVRNSPGKPSGGRDR